MATFVGWIPNVAGRLSFSHIGNSKNPRRCQRLNRGDSSGRLVICHQRRRVSDTLLWPFYFQWLYGYFAMCGFTFCAASKEPGNGEMGVLTGRLYITDDHLAPKAPWGTVQSIVRAVSEATALPWRSEQGRTEVVDKLESALAPKSWGIFSVTIQRDGVVRLVPDDATEAVPAACDYDAGAALAQGASAEYVANQAFFFLKDVAHTHRHHAASSDTITTVSIDDKDGGWCAETHHRLHRQLVQMRSSNDPSKLLNALGVLAYVSSFDELARRLYPDRPGLKYHTSFIADAVKARIESSKWQQTQLNLIRTALPALVIAFLSLTKDQQGGLAELAHQLLGKAFPASWSGVGLALLILAQAPFYYGRWAYTDNRMVRRIRRVWAGLSQNAQGLTWVVGALAAAAVPLLTALANGGFTSHNMWLAAAIDLSIALFALAFLPYVYTIADVLQRVRSGEPVRPKTSN